MTKPTFAALLFPAALLAASCSSAQSGDSAPTSSASSTGPSGSPAAANVTGEQVALEAGSPFSATAHGAFAEPWAIAVHPQSGALFITEKAGTMRFYEPTSGRTGSVTGLPQVAYGGQGGLGDIAFAPDFASSGTVYLSWAAGAGGEARKAVVGRGRLACDAGADCRIEGLTQVWEQSLPLASPGHFSHKIAFSPDGTYLFVSSGDRMQGDPAQDLTNNLGAVVRLMPDGTPAAGNPFADRGAPTDQIWTYGQRNILGLAFDPDGELWGLEHGPRGGDELNHLEPGNNYGWPTRSNGINYDGSDIPDHTADDGFVKPAIFWTPVIAPGDFLFYTGDMWADWRGQALIANLGVPSIVRVTIAGDDASATEAARYPFPNRLRDIAQASDGALWVIEDRAGGRLLRLTPAG
jgi:glucose/arabinose dehydrogenase